MPFLYQWETCLSWTSGAPAKMLKMIDPDAQLALAVTHLYPWASRFLFLLVCAKHFPGSYAPFLAQAQI